MFRQNDIDAGASIAILRLRSRFFGQLPALVKFGGKPSQPRAQRAK